VAGSSDAFDTVMWNYGTSPASITYRNDTLQAQLTLALLGLAAVLSCIVIVACVLST